MKYEITKTSKIVAGVKVYRIKALIDLFSIGVCCGDLGGWIEKEDNLSQMEGCWVYGDAVVYGDACVKENALVSHNARVYGNARVLGNSQIYGNAKVRGNVKLFGNAVVSGYAQIDEDVCLYDNAVVCGNAKVYGKAKVRGNGMVDEKAQVYGDARVYGDAQVYSKAKVSGYAEVCGDAQVYQNAVVSGGVVNGKAFIKGTAVISKSKDYMTISSLGNHSRTITITFSNKKIAAGCFFGGLNSFKKAVNKKYYSGDYYHAIEFIEKLFSK